MINPAKKSEDCYGVTPVCVCSLQEEKKHRSQPTPRAKLERVKLLLLSLFSTPSSDTQQCIFGFLKQRTSTAGSLKGNQTDHNFLAAY